jgi:hypothetical protein
MADGPMDPCLWQFYTRERELKGKVCRREETSRDAEVLSCDASARLPLAPGCTASEQLRAGAPFLSGLT